MSPEEINEKLDRIDAIDSAKDGAMRHMLLAALISKLFAERGVELVVVGGTAMEFYTEGAYVSRDIDFAARAMRYPDDTQDIMALIGAAPQGIPTGRRAPAGQRGYVLERFKATVDLFSDFTVARATKALNLDPTCFNTPFGQVKLVPVEQLIAERVLAAHEAPNDSEAMLRARVLIRLYLEHQTPGDLEPDWRRVEKICQDPDFDVLKLAEKLKS